jgi:hypothetical protein
MQKGATSTHGFSFNDLCEGEFSEVLIHTSYFAIDEFQDLIAAAWVDTGDFTAKPGFKNINKSMKWVDNL